MNNLSVELNSVPIGCTIDQIYNHLMYADDLAVFAPSAIGLQKLLNICDQFGINNDILYNAKKSAVLIVRADEDLDLVFPNFCLNNNIISKVATAKYLGHIFTEKLSDDDDILRQRRYLYIRGNILKRKFSLCNIATKVELFKSYCTQMYTPHLWCSYNMTTLKSLTTAYNQTFRGLMGIPSFCSASQMFAMSNIVSCQALLRNSIYNFMYRIKETNNIIVQSILNSDMRFTSALQILWRNLLYTASFGS